MRNKNINAKDKILLEALITKYGNKNVTHAIKKLNESNNSNDPMVYVGTYAKYNNGSLKGEWVNLSDFSDKDDFIEYCLELHNDEKEPELMFQDYENIPKGLISESDIDESLWEILPLYDEYGEEFINTVMNDCSLSDYDELQSVINDMVVYYADSVEEAVERYCDETMMTTDSDWCERYFDYDSFGYDLRMDNFIESELEDIEDEDERKEREEEFDNMSDSELAEYYINLIGDIKEAVGENNMDRYIDYSYVARDLGYDCDIIESEINDRPVVAFIYR